MQMRERFEALTPDQKQLFMQLSPDQQERVLMFDEPMPVIQVELQQEESTQYEPLLIE